MAKPEEFIYQKRITETGNSAAFYEWYVINKKTREGVHFHGVVSRDPGIYFDLNRYNFMTHGIEMHSKTPRYEGQKALPNCFVTGGDCYHDGTSLGARENLGHIDPTGRDDEQIYSELLYWYRSEFESSKPIKETDDDSV